ncbi:MAG: hypothetical protein IKZ16_07410 [Clostridia bacterium]|nr:hypothetical protein [Clostridia bacterium]
MNGRRLYEEIAGVDERYLQEAGAYRARKKSPAWRTLLIAAALLLSFTVLLGTVAAGVTIGVIGALIDREEQPDQETLTPVEQMEQVMAQNSIEPLAADELALFGAPTLIWSEQGSDEYFCVTLTQSQCEQLVYLMQSSRREYTAQSEQPTYQIWLSFGDGVVVSPYLKNTAGNAGHGAVFDYDPELEMSDDLAEYIAYYIES